MGFHYVTSTPGVLKLAEEVLNLVAFMCIACAGVTTARADAFLVAAAGAFVLTALLLVAYVLDATEKLALPWVQLQFFYCAAWGAFYVITAALVIDEGVGVLDAFVAGGVFGLLAALAYFVDAFFKYKKQM